METLIHILHLEDDPADAELVQAKLAEAGLACRITRAQTRDQFETALRDGGTDIILADYRLPMYDGMSALRLAHERCPDIPFIFVSGTMGEEAAIEALTQGATDYVLKHNLSRLAAAVQRALQEARNRRERRQAQEALQRSNEMLRAIIEAAPVAIIGLDRDGRCIPCGIRRPKNSRLARGGSDGAAVPRYRWITRMSLSDFREQLCGGMTLNGVEVCRQRRDGSPIDYRIYTSPLQTPTAASAAISPYWWISPNANRRNANGWPISSSSKAWTRSTGPSKADDLEEMMQAVLDVVLSIFDCDRAYLMYPCDPACRHGRCPWNATSRDIPGSGIRSERCP